MLSICSWKRVRLALGRAARIRDIRSAIQSSALDTPSNSKSYSTGLRVDREISRFFGCIQRRPRNTVSATATKHRRGAAGLARGTRRVSARSLSDLGESGSPPPAHFSWTVCACYGHLHSAKNVPRCPSNGSALHYDSMYTQPITQCSPR